MLGAIIGTVVDVHPHRFSSAQQRLLEDRQKGLGVLGQGESGVGDDPRGIIDKDALHNN
jgi:hypothetical protein